MTPQVTILLTHHLTENEGYLRQSLEALLCTQGADYEIIVLSDAERTPWEVVATAQANMNPNATIKFVYDRSLNTCTSKIFKGVELSDPLSTHILMVSDDVVVTQHTVKGLYEACSRYNLICNPLCNGNNGYLYHAELTFEDGRAIPQHADLGELSSHELTQIVNMPKGRNILWPRQWVSFLCTMFSKELWDAVGGLDERLDSRHNDEDFCYRATAFGANSVINSGVFAFHYGSKTLNKCVSSAEMDECTKIFQEKVKKWQAN